VARLREVINDLNVVFRNPTVSRAFAAQYQMFRARDGAA
jgi:hypothetical protein